MYTETRCRLAPEQIERAKNVLIRYLCCCCCLDIQNRSGLSTYSTFYSNTSCGRLETRNSCEVSFLLNFPIHPCTCFQGSNYMGEMDLCTDDVAWVITPPCICSVGTKADTVAPAATILDNIFAVSLELAHIATFRCALSLCFSVSLSLRPSVPLSLSPCLSLSLCPSLSLFFSLSRFRSDALTLLLFLITSWLFSSCCGCVR